MTTIRMVPGWQRQLLRDIGVRRYLDAVAGDVRDDIARAAPEGPTGRLRSDDPRFGWRHGVDVDDRGLYGWVGTDSPFWHFPEYGTAHHPAQPYIRPQLYRRR